MILRTLDYSNFILILDGSSFACGKNSSQYIPWSWVCDDEPDCIGGSDESSDLCKNRGACGGNFTSHNGLLTSPSYPEEYPLNADCTYIISQPHGTNIELQIKMFDLYSSDCGQLPDYDYLEIRDGNSDEGHLMGKFCGKKFPSFLKTTRNVAWIK